jgi:hypothetical protein
MIVTGGGRAVPGRRARTRSRAVRIVIAPAAVGLLAAAAVTASPAVASAGSTLKVVYPVHGSTHLKAPNTNVSLGPGKLAVTLNLSSGALTASLSLPAATVSISPAPLIKITATTEFIEVGATTGKVNVNTGAVTTTSKITLKITSLSVDGVPQFVGNSCQSATPAVIKLTSQKGFNPLLGGKLAGTYTVPPFANCGFFGLLTPLINPLIAGPGNTITFILGKAKAA